MTLKFWKWKLWGGKTAPEPEVSAGPADPYIVLSIDTNGHVNQVTHFPVYEDEKAFNQAAKNFGTMLFVLNEGKLLANLQKAVAVAGAYGEYEDVFSGLVLDRLNNLVAEKRGKSGPKPFVRALDTFGYNAADED